MTGNAIQTQPAVASHHPPVRYGSGYEETSGTGHDRATASFVACLFFHFDPTTTKSRPESLYYPNPPKRKKKKAEKKAETPTAASICKEKKRKEKLLLVWTSSSSSSSSIDTGEMR